MLLIDKINEKLTEYNFKLTLESAVYKTKERTLYFEFKYDDSLMLSTKIKDTVHSIIESEFDKKLIYKIKYKKNYYDETIIRGFVLESLRIEYPMVGVRKENVLFTKINGDNEVKLIIDNSYEQFVGNQPIVDYLESKLKQEYASSFKVGIEFKEGVAPLIKKDNENNFTGFSSTTSSDYEIEFETLEPYIG